jgi:hypothetical protein
MVPWKFKAGDFLHREQISGSGDYGAKLHSTSHQEFGPGGSWPNREQVFDVQYGIFLCNADVYNCGPDDLQASLELWHDVSTTGECTNPAKGSAGRQKSLISVMCWELRIAMESPLRDLSYWHLDLPAATG